MDYEAKLEAFYQSLELQGTNIIDIGAHTGRHTVPLARKTGADGMVMAFEPIPLVREYLAHNLATNEINNVVVYPFALSSSACVSEFNYIPNMPEESGLKKRKHYNATPSEFKKLQVIVKRLDQLVSVNQKIDFIKIDVEGAELDVLEGAISLLERDMPIVAFECGAD